MVQWANLQQVEKFVNWSRLYMTCEKSGSLHLVEPGVMASRLADEICARL